jgi:hypothetical protein
MSRNTIISSLGNAIPACSSFLGQSVVVRLCWCLPLLVVLWLAVWVVLR